MSRNNLVNPNDYKNKNDCDNYTNGINPNKSINMDQIKKKRPSQISIISSESYDSYRSHNDSVTFNRLRGLSMMGSYVLLTIRNKIRPQKRLNIRKKIRNFMERFSNND